MAQSWVLRLFMLQVDLKKVVDLLKTSNRASYHLPAVCIKQVLIIAVAVCSHSRCCFDHLD